jgi:hypothetical protein
MVVLKPRCTVIVAILSALLAAGCGGEEGSRPVDLTAPTDTSKFEGMKEQMTKGLKTGYKPAPQSKTPSPSPTPSPSDK